MRIKKIIIFSENSSAIFVKFTPLKYLKHFCLSNIIGNKGTSHSVFFQTLQNLIQYANFYSHYKIGVVHGNFLPFILVKIIPFISPNSL